MVGQPRNRGVITADNLDVVCRQTRRAHDRFRPDYDGITPVAAADEARGRVRGVRRRRCVAPPASGQCWLQFDEWIGVGEYCANVSRQAWSSCPDSIGAAKMDLEAAGDRCRGLVRSLRGVARAWANDVHLAAPPALAARRAGSAHVPDRGSPTTFTPCPRVHEHRLLARAD